MCQSAGESVYCCFIYLSRTRWTIPTGSNSVAALLVAMECSMSE